jgi:glycosyltransferase involved in cell wall biosynthesis
MISYLITTHNELEFTKVFSQVYPYCNAQTGLYRGDEVVILDDFSTDVRMQKQLALCGDSVGCKVVQHSLNGDFGKHKTAGSRECKNPWICQLDADELLSDTMIGCISDILLVNPTVELFRVPRLNIVRGATNEDAEKWGWDIIRDFPGYEGIPIINWNSGDYQARIYKNTEKIKWHKPLHETIVGAEFVAVLPKEIDYAIIHDKTIDRQRAQNEFYNKNWSTSANMGQG